MKPNQIANLIIRGKSNKEIGDALHVSINTIKSYVSRIYQTRCE